MPLMIKSLTDGLMEKEDGEAEKGCRLFVFAAKSSTLTQMVHSSFSSV
jgi:hypothetical protein